MELTTGFVLVRPWVANGLFTRFAYQAGSWPQPRQVAIKCEAGSNGTNRRAVVSNRPGISVLPDGVYGEYADRGESENRNKELKCELGAGRLSDHRYMANCFRMFLHCLAYSLLLAMRRRIASPPEEPYLSAPPCPHLEPTAVPHEIPAEASTGSTCQWPVQSASTSRPLGRRARQHLADDADQSRGADPGSSASRTSLLVWQLAVPSLLLQSRASSLDRLVAVPAGS